MLPDGTINSGQMTSFNHYALGAVADWMHRVIGGIAPAEPGYRTVRIAPRPRGGLTWAETSLDTPHGHIAVAWRLTSDGALDVDVTDPHGSPPRLTCRVRSRAGSASVVTMRGPAARVCKNIGSGSLCAVEFAHGHHIGDQLVNWAIGSARLTRPKTP